MEFICHFLTFALRVHNLSSFFIFLGTITLSQPDLPRFAPGQKPPEPQKSSQPGASSSQRQITQMPGSRPNPVTQAKAKPSNMGTYDFKDSVNGLNMSAEFRFTIINYIIMICKNSKNEINFEPKF